MLVSFREVSLETREKLFVISSQFRSIVTTLVIGDDGSFFISFLDDERKDIFIWISNIILQYCVIGRRYMATDKGLPSL